ncbi:MAG: NAD(P)H-dependent oxidoreductase [Flavobacteriales bacterium]|nr:NAD(P)H-dependent oxidoreductase [Flavobacteriales bacterium]
MITIIVGTNREKSNSKLIAELYHSLLKSKGVSSQVFEIENLPKDFAWSECFGARTEAYGELLNKYVVTVDKFVFILPEYHGGYPGIVKSFIDSWSGDMAKGKHAALVGLSSGRAGNLRGLDAFAAVLGYLQVEVLANRPKLSGIEEILKGGILNSAEGMDRIEQQIDQLITI